MAAISLLEEEQSGQLFTTGLLYINEDRKTAVEREKLVDQPLVHLPDSALRPPRAALDAVMAEYL
jgi:2-oxoglutarate ferredoxin oxidoreductase subunit beta